MTGKFTEKDPQRCEHYARFMSRLTLAEANAIFWVTFVLVIILMCIGSLQHHKSNALTEYNKSLPEHITKSERHQLKTRRTRLGYLSVASLCLVIAATATVFECFALFNIEFCQGEDLMQIYWGFWSVLQVGSNIAILGVMVQFWIVLGDIETPSWAVALGTPVLVFAAIGFGFRHIFKETIGRFTKGKKVAFDEEMGRGRHSDVDDESVGPMNEIDSEKYQGGHNGDRSLSTAPTMVQADGGPSRDSSISPAPQDDSISPAPPAPPVIRPVNVGRHSTFWQRDLRAILNSVVAAEPPPEDSRTTDRHHREREHGRAVVGVHHR